MIKALIFGAGGVDCIYGYTLDRGGVEVTAIRPTNYEAVEADGTSIRSKLWGNVHYRPAVVRAVTEARGPFDFILVCSKAFPGTSRMIEAVVSERTAIVLAHNGIGIEEEYAQLYPNNNVISGVVWLPTTQVEPGECQNSTPLPSRLSAAYADLTLEALSSMVHWNVSR